MLDTEFDLLPSRSGLMLCIGIMMIGLCVVTTVQANWLYKLLMLVFLAVYGGYLARHLAFLSAAKSVFRLKHVKDDRWLVQTKQGVFDVIRSNKSVVTPMVSALQFTAVNKKQTISCLIFPDSLPEDRYRQLVVMLRMF